MKQTISIALIGILIMYILWAFVIWEFNPGNWKESNRALLSLLSAAWIAMSYPIKQIINLK